MGKRNEPKSIEQIKRANRERGHYYFSPDTMRFFRSEVESKTFNAGWGRTLFITSEHGPGGPRGWAVSLAKRDGSIERMTDIRSHQSYSEAHSWAVIMSDLMRRRVDPDEVRRRWRNFRDARSD